MLSSKCGFYISVVPTNIYYHSKQEAKIYLHSHYVGSYEIRHFPARDSAAYNDPDQAEDPEGHTSHLNTSISHSERDVKIKHEAWQM